jgi:hypothetical protein
MGVSVGPSRTHSGGATGLVSHSMFKTPEKKESPSHQS